jgi:hypothetical protein
VTAAKSPRHINLLKIVYALAGLCVFILALQLMKAGARQLAPVLEDPALLQTPLQALGLGWLGAYLVLSGSPVAAAALGLFNGGAITELQTFLMINGSRMGSSFIVLFVGFLMWYAATNQRRLSIRLLTTLTTWTTYVPAMLLGIPLNQRSVHGAALLQPNWRLLSTRVQSHFVGSPVGHRAAHLCDRGTGHPAGVQSDRSPARTQVER